MSLSPTSKFRERMNLAIRAHVEMQLADRMAATEERLAKIEEALVALQATTGTLQHVTTDLSASLADRMRVVEQALEETFSRRASAGGAKLD